MLQVESTHQSNPGIEPVSSRNRTRISGVSILPIVLINVIGNVLINVIGNVLINVIGVLNRWEFSDERDA